jgi:translocation and assembly module TamB
MDAFTLSLPAFLQDVTLQVRLRGARQAVRISNNLAKIPLDLDIELRGTVEHPVLLGRVSATAGTFTFLHTPFQVTAGSIDFLDPKRTRAGVDLKARTTVRDYAIDLTLTGTTERFTLELASDPPLSEADILSVLTVGHTTEEVTVAGGGTVATSEAAALLVDEFIEERAQRWIGIDRLEVSSVVDRSGVDLGPQLTIGKELIKDKLLVLISWPLDPTMEAPVRLEYGLNRYISLIGERDETGRLGGDLKFRFDFR